MIKFKFRLQSVLEARIKAFENSQLALAKVQNRLNKETLYLEHLYSILDKSKKDLEILISGNIDFTIINCNRNYIEKLRCDIKNQHKIITDIEIELEEKKQELLESMKAKTMLEKLKEKALKEFKAESERLDMLEIDEISTSRYIPPSN